MALVISATHRVVACTAECGRTTTDNRLLVDSVDGNTSGTSNS